MRATLKDHILIVIPETDEERSAFGAWREAHPSHVFHLTDGGVKGGAFHDLGPRPVACREPINVVFNLVERKWRVISNLAESPFELRGRRYASVEGFWQGLKFEDEAQRAEIANLAGAEAVRAGAEGASEGVFNFDGQTCAFGGPGHHALMREACWAKFTQHAEARSALLASGERPLTHRTRRDSQNIPGALMADIWMRIRTRLRRQQEERLRPGGRETICYFGRDRDLYGFMSHFEPSPIELDGERWPTVEHFYQSQKSFDPEYRAAIRAAAAPGAAKQLATAARADGTNAATSWFARTGRTPRPDWAEIKLDLMRRADSAKFTQNPVLAARLIETGEAELIEDSPYDAFWGTGPNGDGLNWAGRILMEIREALRAPPDGRSK